MKKYTLTVAAIFGLTFFAQAQEISDNAIGLRFGNNDGLGAEISYQKKLARDNRLELDLGFRNSNDSNAYKLVGLYQWVWELDKNFNWYAGAGAGVGSVNVKGSNSSSYFLGSGNVGIEYLFDFPIQVSLDYRPEFYFGNDYFNNYGSDVALSVRYRF